ncbi:MAG: tyrosine-type recombinase/integrase [Paracoccaceae bacterium]
MRLQDQEIDILSLSKACNARKTSGRRNRLLLRLASTTGLPIGNIVRLRLWQLTYFFELEHGDVHRYPQRAGNIGTRPRPYTSIGLYLDDSFQRLVPIPASIYKILRGYLGTLEEQDERTGFVFPVIRKNDRIEHDRTLTVRDAHKILREMQTKANTEAHFDWNKIRQIAVAGMLSQRLSLQEIRHRTHFKDLKSIKDTAKKYGYDFESIPSFSPKRFVGLDFLDGVLKENLYWYPQELYEYAPPLYSKAGL